MSLSTHKTAVGLFSLAGMALLIFGIIALGGGRFFKDETQYVLYFNTSVSGLSIGAPVIFRGVPLGSVTHISLVANTTKSNVSIPVNISINSNNLLLATGKPVNNEEDEQKVIQDMVAKGMRAQLELSSLITGQFCIALDFYPDTSAEFQSSTPELEIPTIASPMDTFTKTLERVPVEKIVSQLDTILLRLTELSQNKDIDRAIKNCADMFDAATKLLQGMEPLQAQLAETLSNAQTASRQLPGAVASFHKSMEGLPEALASFQTAMGRLQAAADQFRKASEGVGNTINPGAPIFQELQRTIKEAREAVRSLRSFSSMMERNPESVIQGRKGAY